MTVRIGSNANPSKSYDAADLSFLGVQWTRTVLYAGREYEFLDWADRCQDFGIEAQMIVLPQYVTGWEPGWTHRELQPYAEALAAMCNIHPGLVRHAWIANEPNGTGPSSTHMTAEDFAEWLIAFSTALTPCGVVCISGALAGPVEYLEPILDVVQATCGMVGVDPYTSIPWRPWKDWEGSTIAEVVDLVAGYTGLPVAVGEIGWETYTIDAEGVEHPALSESDQADYYRDLVIAARRYDAEHPGVLPLFGIFCQGDDDVAGFGMQRTDGSPKPSYYGYRDGVTEIIETPPTEDTLAKIEEREKAPDFPLGARWAGPGQTWRIHNLGDGVRTAGYELGSILEIDGYCWQQMHVEKIVSPKATG